MSIASPYPIELKPFSKRIGKERERVLYSMKPDSSAVVSLIKAVQAKLKGDVQAKRREKAYRQVLYKQSSTVSAEVSKGHP